MSDVDPRAARPVRGGPFVGGIVLGFVLAIAAQALLFSLLPPLGLEQTRQVAYAIFWVPAVAGLGLLLSRRTRRVGGGLVVGLSIGAVLAAAGCTASDAVTLG